MKKILVLFLVIFSFVPAAFSKVVSEPVNYIENGEALQGFIYYDDGAKKKLPGIIVIHEWKGLGEYAKKRAEMLAGLGYAAFAADMYGKGIFAKDHEEAGQLSGAFFKDRKRMRARAAAAYDAFLATGKVDETKVAAIGYCFGGTTVLEMARSGMPLKGVASFHGILATPAVAEAGQVKAKILVLTGAEDKMVMPGDILSFENEMRTAKIDWQLVRFGGAKHSFTVWDANLPEQGIQYNAKADKRSWAMLQDFLKEIFNIK